MAYLRKGPRAAHIHELPSYGLVGRKRLCHLRLDDSLASKTHAEIFWTGEHWMLRDLSSRNGTWVDGRKVAPGKRVILEEGLSLAFGNGDATWIFEDAAEPVPLARCLDSNEIQLLHNEVEDDEAPSLRVRRLEEGGWLLMSGGWTRTVVDEQILVIDGRPWELSLPLGGDHGRTQGGAQVHLAHIELQLRHSRDEEVVEVAYIDKNGLQKRLPNRVYFYTLLHMARMYKNDLREGFSPDECGWRINDVLYRDLRLSRSAFNLHMFRIRQVFRQNGVVDSVGIVARRGDRTRIGTERFVISELDAGSN